MFAAQFSPLIGGPMQNRLSQGFGVQQSFGPVVTNETFTIEPILLESNHFGSTDDSSTLQPQQVMLLFDDHTYDDEKIASIHKEVETRYGIRG
jgi:hypothetical protein